MALHIETTIDDDGACCYVRRGSELIALGVAYHRGLGQNDTVRRAISAARAELRAARREKKIKLSAPTSKQAKTAPLATRQARATEQLTRCANLYDAAERAERRGAPRKADALRRKAARVQRTAFRMV
jgi:hypothetical protein